MAIQQYTLTDTAWQAISTVGQSGTAWLESMHSGGGPVRIYHKTGAPPDLTVVKHGYPMRHPNVNFDAVQLIPDSGLDIFYALCEQGTATITVDVK